MTRGRALAGQVVEQVLDLVLDEAALLLHDEDLVEPAGEALDAVRLQRPTHADLVEGQAQAPRCRLVDAEIVERLGARRDRIFRW